MHARACPTLGLDPGHHLGPARPGVGNTPGFTADGAVPGCPLHGEARVRPHPPACAGYFTPYIGKVTRCSRAALLHEARRRGVLDLFLAEALGRG